MKIYGKLEISTVDGPGRRVVVHTAGGASGCIGCFNPWTHAKEGDGVTDISVRDLANQIHDLMVNEELDGLSISGGEPTDQLADLSRMLELVRYAGCDSVVLYTGRTMSYLRQLPIWILIEREKLVDVVIDGRYVKSLPEDTWHRGSSNQRIICMSSRHTLAEFKSRDSQVEIDTDGRIVVLGFPSEELINSLQKEV